MKSAILGMVTGCVLATATLASTYCVTTEKRGYTIDVLNRQGRDVSIAEVTVTETSDTTAVAHITAPGYKPNHPTIYFNSYQQLVLRRFFLSDVDVKVQVLDKTGAKVYGTHLDLSQVDINGNEYLVKLRMPSEFTKFKFKDMWVDPKFDAWANVWNAPGGRQADIRIPRKTFGDKPQIEIVVKIPTDAQLREQHRERTYERIPRR
jgi:hypothetical protein